MNVVCDPQPNCIVNLQVELPADQVSREWLSIAKDFQRHARIPGYRPGKAPQSLIDTRFAKEIREELEKNLLRESLDEAIKQKNLRILSVSKVEDVQIGEDKTMRYRACLVTAPEFELPDYSAITVELAKRQITDEDMEKWLGQVRDSYSTFETITDRPAAMGDYAVMTYEGRLGGQPLSEAIPKAPTQLQGRRNAWIYLDEDTLVPGFAKAVEGMVLDEERSFTLEMPADFLLEDLRGAKVDYTATLHGINVKKLPPLDDALAEKIEPGKTLEDLRTKMRENAAIMAESQFQGEKRHAALGHLLAAVQCELPAQTIQREVSSILREIVQENQGRGISDEELRSHQDEIVGHAQQTAVDRVRGNFLLLRIAEKEKLEVSQTDMVGRISEMARHHDIPVKKLLRELEARDGLASIREQILMGKALDLIAANVTVREPAGVPSQT